MNQEQKSGKIFDVVVIKRLFVFMKPYTRQFVLLILLIILLAALQDIPEQLYEAATIDGANTWNKFWRITLPLLQSVLVFVITITIISSFNLFGQPLFMTNNGPSRGTEPVMFRIYDEGFNRNAQGSAAAMSFVVALIMILISYLTFRLFSKKDTDY